MLRSLRWVLRRAFAAAPWMLSLTAVGTLLLSTMPALQVLLIAELLERLGPNARFADISGQLVALVAVVGLTPSLGNISEAFLHRAAQRLQAALNSDLARQAARIPPVELVTTQVSANVERNSRAIGETVAWMPQRLLMGIQSVLSAVGVVATVFTFSGIAGVLTAFALVPSLIYSRHLAGVWEREWESVGPEYDRERYLREQFIRPRGATELASLGTAERMADVVAQRWSTIDGIMTRSLRPQTIGSLASGLTTSALLAGALVSVVIGAQFDTVAAAGIYAVMSAMTAASGAGLQLGLVIEGLPMIRSLRSFLEPERPSRTSTDSATPHAVDTLEVRGLAHRYPRQDTPAIRDVDLCVRRGETIALVGVNGAGKTTTIHAILGLIDPDTGSIRADGTSLQDVGEAAWLSRFGLLSQEFGRFEMTIRDAVRLSSPREDVGDEEVWQALRRAHAAHMVERMPDGLDQQLGEQWAGIGISGGQWQRLALARIHLRDAPIRILDEPTSAIDAEAEQEIFAELLDSKQDRITIVVSHRAWTLKGMDRIHVFDEGSIVESGTYEELLARGGRFAEIFAQQSAT